VTIALYKFTFTVTITIYITIIHTCVTLSQGSVIWYWTKDNVAQWLGRCPFGPGRK